MTLKDFPINPEYTVPKGTMLIPSIWPSLHDPEVYPEPDSFIPERWLDPATGEPIEDPNPKNYMVWGAGAHKVRCPYSLAGLHRRRPNPDPALYLSFASGVQCIGFEYVYSFMIASVGYAAITMDWEHKLTPDSGKLQVIATLFPRDGLVLKVRLFEGLLLRSESVADFVFLPSSQFTPRE